MMTDLWLQDIARYAHYVFMAWQPLAVIPSVLFALWLIVPLRHRGPNQYDRCARCDYIIKGLTKPTCPECGSDLSNRGVRPAGDRRYSAWVSRLFTWTFACLAAAALFGGPLLHHVPQTYHVSWSLFQPGYIDDESGHQISIAVNGRIFRWPWQQTVTTRAMRVYISATSNIQTPGRSPDTFMLLWSPSQNTILRWKRGSARGTVIDKGPLTVEQVSRLLHAPPAAEPIQTAQRIMVELDAHRNITTDVYVRMLHLQRGQPIAWATPADREFVTTLVRWVCLVLWIVGGVLFHYRWHRDKCVDWDATGTN